jgi:L-ascorbate metabolism protein UlaG (beta-lactamase superfamily)
MKFTWMGGPSFLLELGPFRIVGDPVLVDLFELDGVAVTRAGARPNVDVTGTDLVLVTSLRADHFDAKAITGCDAARVLVPDGCAGPAAEAGVPGVRDLPGREPIRMEKGGAALTVHQVPGGAAADPPAERSNGYFLALDGARPFTAYVTGDALFSESTREIQRTLGYSNLLILYLGAERVGGRLRSADAREAMQIVYRMQPNAIAAVHHSTFSHYTEPIAAFLDKLSLTIYDKRLRSLREGEWFEKRIAPPA